MYILGFKREIEEANMIIVKDVLYLDHVTLSEFICDWKLMPKESYEILQRVVQAMQFLHQRHLTLCQQLCSDNICVFKEGRVCTYYLERKELWYVASLSIISWWSVLLV